MKFKLPYPDFTICMVSQRAHLCIWPGLHIFLLFLSFYYLLYFYYSFYLIYNKFYHTSRQTLSNICIILHILFLPNNIINILPCIHMYIGRHMHTPGLKLGHMTDLDNPLIQIVINIRPTGCDPI